MLFDLISHAYHKAVGPVTLLISFFLWLFFFCFEFFFPSSQLWNTSIAILFFTCEYRVEMKQLAVFLVKSSLEYGPIQFILFVDFTKISKDSPFSMRYCFLQVKICHFCQDQSKYICFIFCSAVAFQKQMKPPIANATSVDSFLAYFYRYTKILVWVRFQANLYIIRLR